MTMKSIPSWIIPIELPMSAAFGTVNVYLIRGSKGNALIDTGMNDITSQRRLTEQLSRYDLDISNIETVICTHHHADHSGLGRTFKEAGARVMMSSIDAASLKIFFRQPELDSKRATFFGLHEVPPDFEKRITPMFPFFRGWAQDFEPTDLLEDGQKISLGGVDFKVILTTGHTAGHICLAHESGIIFTGDCITEGSATHVSIRQETMGRDPLQQFINSLARLRDLNMNTALPGHGKPILNVFSRAAALIEHHNKRLGQVQDLLNEKPQTAYDLSIKAMGSRPKPFACWLAMSQTIAYLEHLESQGRCKSIQTPTGHRYIEA